MALPRRAVRPARTSCASCIASSRLATTARTWDELLETVVDETRDALHADVSSLYLLDRDGAYLTLAATNGLDRFQIGRARVPVRRGRDRPRRGDPPAARHPRRQGGSALPVGPRHRPAALRRVDAQRAAGLARPGRRRAQRPDRAAPRVRAGGRRPARRGRRPARGHRREGPPAVRGGGPGRGAQGHRRGSLRAHRPGDPRAAHPARRRPRLRGPAGRGTDAGRPRVARHRATPDPPRLARGDARADRAAGPPRRLDPRLGPGRPGGRRRGHAGRRRAAGRARSSGR